TNKWHDEIHRELEPAAIGGLKYPKIVTRCRKDPGDRCHRFQIEQRISVRLCSTKLLREAAILIDLIRHDHSLKTIPAVVQVLLVTGQVSERRDLHHPARAMIILGFSLIADVLAGRHTLETLC